MVYVKITDYDTDSGVMFTPMAGSSLTAFRGRESPCEVFLYYIATMLHQVSGSFVDMSTISQDDVADATGLPSGKKAS